MLAKVYSCTTFGLTPYLVEVEVDVAGGLPDFTIVGLPDVTVKESKERVRTAIKNSGYDFPARKIIVNLAPADMKKEGPGFDLPIAIGILAATGQLNSVFINEYVLVGELSLDGRIRPVPGVLPMALFVQRQNVNKFIIPMENSTEASLVSTQSYSFHSLGEVKDFLERPDNLQAVKQTCLEDYIARNKANSVDFSQVKGQRNAKRALEVAAAGGHNILLIGTPGSGKSLLAKCLPAILPPLTPEEALEVSKIYSVAGLLNKDMPLITQRPFRSPHHSSSAASLIGGGNIPRPGEVTLATHGVLFLDELPEYRRDVLEALRQPLEDRIVTVSRIRASITYPAKFQLVAAANPCYCGFFGDRLRECICTPYQVNKYRSKISGPLLDRLDLHVEVPRLTYQEMEGEKSGESAEIVRQRVWAARGRQLARFEGLGINCNAEMGLAELQKFCSLQREARLLLKEAYMSLALSARAHDRIIKIARTIADISGSEQIKAEHLAEAIQYRGFEQKDTNI